MPITGNKGEWSEIYVLLRLLGEGKIHAADENMQKSKEIYFPILKIIREEFKSNTYEYKICDTVKIFLNQILVQTFPTQEFNEEANYLYDQIIQGKNRTFSIDKTEKFMHKIYCKKLKAPSSDKRDITMQIHDIKTGYSPVCGFSIKSELGSPPTLVNASKSTNFIFEVGGLSDEQIKSINAINNKGSKIIDRMKRIFTESTFINFVKSNSNIFTVNLMLIDSKLHELIANMLLYSYRENIKDCNKIIEQIELDNPMNYPGKGFYRYKFKKYLCSAALGMNPSKVWNGRDDANGGYIIVTTSGSVLAYYIYNRNFFEDYLLDQTEFERASTTKHDFASLYKENGKTYLKLNLQIRFK